jgi:hypothetical protein
MSNNQLNIYYRKDAEEEVKFKYEQEICKIKRKIQIDKENAIINAKQIVNDKYIKESKILKNNYTSEFEIEYANIEKEFENILEIFDKETDKLTITNSDEELIQNIKLENYENEEEYQKKVRDTLRSAKGQSRKINQERRSLRRNLINDIIELKQEKKMMLNFKLIQNIIK